MSDDYNDDPVDLALEEVGEVDENAGFTDIDAYGQALGLRTGSDTDLGPEELKGSINEQSDAGSDEISDED